MPITFERNAKATVTPLSLNHDDILRFTLRNGTCVEIVLLATSAEIVERDYARYHYLQQGEISAYAFNAVFRINGREVNIRRVVGTQQSFYEPYEQDGVRLWLDAVAAIFVERGGFMLEKDWLDGIICMPRRHARIAVQDATLSICPEPMALWCDLPESKLDIRQCYNGEDCWMGPYAGALTHGGLDINMPSGAVLYAPVSFDNQFYFNSLAAGYNNNCWCGIRRWPDGGEWHLQTLHLNQLLVPQRTPLERGTAYAHSAGVFRGAHEHTHFVFRVLEQGGDYLLDPWLLFWQMFRDQRSLISRTPLQFSEE